MKQIKLTNEEISAVKNVLFIWNDSIKKGFENNAMSDMNKKSKAALYNDMQNIYNVLKKL
jgi:hypothetical protein